MSGLHKRWLLHTILTQDALIVIYQEDNFEGVKVVLSIISKEIIVMLN